MTSATTTTRRRALTGLAVVAALAGPAVGSSPPPPGPALPPEYAGLTAPDIHGVSARPARVWATTLRVLRELGMPAPAGARFGWLPYDTTIGGVAIIRENRVLIDPLDGTGDGRNLPATMAHEALHLASHAAATRVIPDGDPAEEGFVDAVAMDLVPVIRRRLGITPLPASAPAYHQQVMWARRVTLRACRRNGGTARAVDRCARHARRWFITATDPERAAALQAWGAPRAPGVRVPDWRTHETGLGAPKGAQETHTARAVVTTSEDRR